VITVVAILGGLLLVGIGIQIKSRQKRRVKQERIDEVRDYWLEAHR
jgi:hypothetical protein